jgi:hypothetical protein
MTESIDLLELTDPYYKIHSLQMMRSSKKKKKKLNIKDNHRTKYFS